MSEDWGSVAEDIVSALKEVGFGATLHRSVAASKPWDASLGPSSAAVTVLNKGLITERLSGSTELRQSHVIVISATVEPKVSDLVEMLGRKRKVLKVKEIAPGGVTLLYRVEIEQ